MKQNLAGLLAIVALTLGVFAVSAGAQSAQDDPAQVEAGMGVYEANCAGCHGAAGDGDGPGRSLIDIATEQPDRLVHIASVTDGIGTMPGFGDRLTGDEIDAAVSYLRITFATAQDTAADPVETPEEPAEAEPVEEAEPIEEALPVTGSSSLPLAVAGVAMIVAGAVLILPARRLRE